MYISIFDWIVFVMIFLFILLVYYFGSYIRRVYISIIKVFKYDLKFEYKYMFIISYKFNELYKLFLKLSIYLDRSIYEF